MTISESCPEEPPQDTDSVSKASPCVSDGSGPASSNGHPGTIQVLLVDDNAIVRETASKYLEAAGYSVTLASNGFDALARVVQSRPDVVLADITMPKLDGYQMCSLMKSNSDYMHIPVIMITGRDGLLDQTRATLVGSKANVSKPFTEQALTKAVNEVAHSQQLGEG